MAKSFFQDLLTFNGISNSKIIRLNADGSPDPSFTTGVGFNATVSSCIQPDGKIIAGGDFVVIMEIQLIKLFA
jgi:hypothetical protein